MTASWVIVALVSRGQKLGWINGLFLFGIGFLVVSGGTYVIRGGFFSLFARGFRKLVQRPEMEDWVEKMDTNRTIKLQWIVPACLLAGVVDTALSFALLYL